MFFVSGCCDCFLCVSVSIGLLLLLSFGFHPVFFFFLRVDVCVIFAVADADVITALTKLGILEPTQAIAAAEAAAETTADTEAAPPTTTTDSAPRADGELAVPVAAGNGGGSTATVPVFKPKDAAALRAVAVQVLYERMTD